MTRQRFVDILITAIIGAGIAFLQSLLLGLTGTHIPTPDPVVAAAAGGTLKFYINNQVYS